MQETKKKFLDIRETFKAKNPKLYSVIPGFVFSLIARIVHEDFMNDFLVKYGHLQGLDFVNCLIRELKIDVSIVHEKNIPVQGKYLFISNHPYGGIDGIALMYVLRKQYPDVKLLVNDILLNIKNLEEFFVPINKVGKQSHENAKRIEDVFMADNQIVTFPAGLVSRKMNGKILDPPWKKNFLSKAIEHKRDIIPIFFTGRISNLFYSVARIRKFLGIKMNIEMLLLPHESFKDKERHFTIIIGEPIPYQTFDNSKSKQEWVEWLRQKVYALSQYEIEQK